MKPYASWAAKTIDRIQSGDCPKLNNTAHKLTEAELRLISWLPIAFSRYSFDLDANDLTLVKVHLGEGSSDTAINIKVLKATHQTLCLAVLTYATVSADADFSLFLSSAGEQDDIPLGKSQKSALGQWPITFTVTFVNNGKDDCKIIDLTLAFVDSIPTIDFGEIEPTTILSI